MNPTTEPLTLEQIKALPDLEVNVLIAEWLGLPVIWSSLPPYISDRNFQPTGRMPYLKGNAHECYYDWANVPKYSSDLNEAWKLERQFGHDEALQTAYCQALNQVLKLSISVLPYFYLTHATARARCEAILLMAIPAPRPEITVMPHEL